MTRRVKRTLGGEDRFCAAHRNPVVIGFFHSVRILVKTVVRGWWVWLGLALGFGSLGGFFWQQEQPAIALPCLLIAIFFVLYALFSEARKSISHIFDSSKALVLDVASSCLWYLARVLNDPAESQQTGNPDFKKKESGVDPVQDYEQALKGIEEIRGSLARLLKDLQETRPDEKAKSKRRVK